MNKQFPNIELREPFNTPKTYSAIEFISYELSEKLYRPYKRKYIWPLRRFLENEGIINEKQY